jgi:N-acetylneuraminic acid mutarotase
MLYVVAGKNDLTHKSSMFIYDPLTDAWTSGPDLPGEAVEDAAVTTLNGKFYVFGGGTGPFSGAVTNAAVFDPGTLSWTSLAPMSVPRAGATAEALGGLIYVAGGMDFNGASLDSVEVYNPATNTWSDAPSMSTRRDNLVSAVFDGKIFVFGGRIRETDGSSPDPGLRSVEAFDPDTGEWTPREPMPTGRRRMIIGTINGRAQIMGGERTSEKFPMNEEYDPFEDTWRTLSPIPTPRHGAAYGTINDVLYVTGGGPEPGFSLTDVTEAFAFQNP